MTKGLRLEPRFLRYTLAEEPLAMILEQNK